MKPGREQIRKLHWARYTIRTFARALERAGRDERKLAIARARYERACTLAVIHKLTTEDHAADRALYDLSRDLENRAAPTPSDGAASLDSDLVPALNVPPATAGPPKGNDQLGAAQAAPGHSPTTGAD